MRARLATALFATLGVACGPRAVLGAHGAGPGTLAPAATLGDPSGEARAAAIERADQRPAERTTAPIADAPAAPPSPFLTSGVVLSRLPAPHRLPPMAAPPPTTVAAARTWIGRRDPRPPLAFAVALAAALTGGAAPAVADGPALVAWAQAEGTWGAATALAAGDLVVFDRAVADAPASLVAVALGTDDRGVTELIYLASGVVRLAHLDAARPTLARDREGRAVNSYLRHGRDYPPAGTRYLAGELVGGRIRLRAAPTR